MSIPRLLMHVDFQMTCSICIMYVQYRYTYPQESLRLTLRNASRKTIKINKLVINICKQRHKQVYVRHSYDSKTIFLFQSIQRNERLERCWLISVAPNEAGRLEAMYSQFATSPIGGCPTRYRTRLSQEIACTCKEINGRLKIRGI